MRKVAIFLIAALALIGIAFAVVPFQRRGIDYGAWHTSGFGNCSAPVVSAFQSDGDGGWFGYAPVTSTQIESPLRLPTCRSDGQRRLQYAGMFILAAVVSAIALRRHPDTSSSPHDPNDPNVTM